MKEVVLLGIVSPDGQGIQLKMPEKPGDLTDRVQSNEEFMKGTLKGIQQLREGKFHTLAEVKKRLGDK